MACETAVVTILAKLSRSSDDWLFGSLFNASRIDPAPTGSGLRESLESKGH